MITQDTALLIRLLEVHAEFTALPAAASVMRAAAVALSDLSSAQAQPRCAPAHLAGYLSPDVPAGWQTVLGYLATYQPLLLDTLDCSYPETTQRDGFKLSHWCRREGYSVRRVLAPPVMAAMGVCEVRVYPLSLLERRFA